MNDYKCTYGLLSWIELTTYKFLNIHVDKTTKFNSNHYSTIPGE